MEVQVLPGNLVSQEIIDGSAGAFIIRGSRDARDASVSVESQGAVLLISSGSHGSGSSLVLPFCRPFIEQMHQVRFGWFRMNGGGQQLRAHFRLFICDAGGYILPTIKNDRRLRPAEFIKLILGTSGLFTKLSEDLQ